MNILNTLSDAQILKSKRALKKQLLLNEDLTEKKIALLSGSTIGEIQPIYELYLLSHGIKPTFFIGQYNRYYEEAVFCDSSLGEFAPDLIYVHTSNFNIDKWPNPTDSEEQVLSLLNETFEKQEQVLSSLTQNHSCPIIQNNFEPLPYRILGNYDVVSKSGRLNYINALNERLYSYARDNSNIYINDIAYLSSLCGIDNWSDANSLYLYKYALSPQAIPLLCKSIANITKAIFGKNKKVLSVDLDNTLWGGIVGDDKEIAIGDETPIGYAYSDFQKYIKALISTGVLLNACSKNEEKTAKEAFSLPNQVLSAEDFALFQANWNEKSENLKDASTNLNLLLESFVFVDDNPAERELVLSMLPEVEVVSLTSEPSEYISCIDRQGYFESVGISQDDIKRNSFYRSDQKRKEAQKTFASYEEYLSSLEMTCELTGFSNVSRITQLVNKTNQFNLTTLRYTQSEIENIAISDSYIKISARLKDKFGDNGIVSVLIGKVDGNVLNIDLWVMSCRVFKRNLEFTMLDELIRLCKEAGIKTITGQYIPTAKNAFVANLYESLGFIKTTQNHFEYVVTDEYTNKNQVMGVTYL